MGYLRAASRISTLALGDRTATPTSDLPRPRTASQNRHAEGAPLGTRGGLSVVHVFRRRRYSLRDAAVVERIVWQHDWGECSRCRSTASASR
jgi:hypothetical protein